MTHLIFLKIQTFFFFLMGPNRKKKKKSEKSLFCLLITRISWHMEDLQESKSQVSNQRVRWASKGGDGGRTAHA